MHTPGNGAVFLRAAARGRLPGRGSARTTAGGHRPSQAGDLDRAHGQHEWGRRQVQRRTVPVGSEPIRVDIDLLYGRYDDADSDYVPITARQLIIHCQDDRLNSPQIRATSGYCDKD